MFTLLSYYFSAVVGKLVLYHLLSSATEYTLITTVYSLRFYHGLDFYLCAPAIISCLGRVAIY